MSSRCRSTRAATIALETTSATSASAAVATRASSFDRNDRFMSPQFSSSTFAPFRAVPAATYPIAPGWLSTYETTASSSPSSGGGKALSREDPLLPVAPHRRHRAREDLFREADSRPRIGSEVDGADGRVVRPASHAAEEGLADELAIEPRDRGAGIRDHDVHGPLRLRSRGGGGERDDDERPVPHVPPGQKDAVVLSAKSAQCGSRALKDRLPFRLVERPAVPRR